MKRGRGKLGMWLAAGFAAVALLCAPAAPAALYWGDSGTIGAANLDGTSPNSKYFRFHHPMGPISDVAVTDSHLYWAEWFGIWRVNFEGPATPIQIASGMNNPEGIATDGANIYWTNRDGNALARAALDGSGRNDAFVTGLDGPCEVAAGGNYIYWIDWRGIGRARLDGTGVEESFIPTGPGGCGLAVDAGHIYWSTGEGTIGRASLDGTFLEPRFIAGTGRVSSIAVAGDRLYWTDQPEGMAYSSIDTAILGTVPVRDLIVPPIFSIGGVAVDARPTPPPLALPSRPILSFGKPRHDKRVGSLVLDVWVPERGDLTVAAPKLGWKLIKGPEPPPWQGGSFRWRLKVWPGKTTKGTQLRTRLRNKGWAKVALRLSYTEEGQLPYNTIKPVVLRQLKKPK